MRLILTAAAVAVTLALPAHAAAELVTVGPDLASGPAPAEHCGATSCTATQSTLAANASGTVTQLRLRHGVTYGGLAATSVRVVVFSPSLSVLRESAAVTLPAASSEQVTTLTTSVAVTSGELLGVRVDSGWAGDETAVLGVASGETVSTSTGARADRRLLANFLIDTAAGGSGDDGGTGDGGSGDGSGDGGSTPSTQPGCGSLAPISAGYPKAWTRYAARARGRGWTGTVIGRQDTFNEVALTLDGRGRPHVAARGAMYGGAYYFGPQGGRKVGRAEKLTGEGISVALDRAGRPLVSWGSTDALTDSTGLLRYCPALWVASGAGFASSTLNALADGAKGFSYSDVATDSRGRVHAAYDIGERLYYDPPVGAPLRLALAGKTRAIRIAVEGTRVAIAVRTDGDRLVLFTGSGRRFAARALSSNAGEFDLAFGADGRPRVAFADGSLPKLAIYDGRRVVRTGVSVGTVGLGMRGNRPQVVFTRAGRPTCIRFFGCLSNGIHHLDANAAVTRGTFSVVQPTVGYAPARLSVAVRGTRVAVAYGDPGNNGWLTVRSRTVR